MLIRKCDSIWDHSKISFDFREMNFGKRYMNRMMNLKNILKRHRINKKDMVDIDQLMTSNNLSYADLDFQTDNSDILKSYQNINRKLNRNNRFIQNLREVFPYISFKPILKPAYTVILTVVVIIAAIQYKNFTKPVQYAEITVDQGEKVTLHINDQFTVYLNSGSSIKVPMNLKRNSEILFEGEAYFNINLNKKIAIVSNGIHFTGNHVNFSINTNYPNQLIANVEDGEISLYNPEMPKSTQLKLQNGDKATYNSIAKFVAVEKQINKNYLAWHTGIIKFDKTPLHSAVKDISNYFDIPIQIENKQLITEKITAQFNILEIDNILDKIQSQFNCQISADGSKIVIN